MIDRLVLAVSLGVVPVGCDYCASLQPDIESLRALERLDPTAMASMAVKRGDFSLLSVYEDSEFVPGISDQSCALTRMRRRVIDPTTDDVCGPEHFHLKRGAAAYAERYNLVVQQHRKMLGLPSCES
jgi:hypothetical protein